MCSADKYIIQTYNYVNELFQYIGNIQPLQRVEKSRVPQMSKSTPRLCFFSWLVFICAKIIQSHTEDLGWMSATEIDTPSTINGNRWPQRLVLYAPLEITSARRNVRADT